MSIRLFQSPFLPRLSPKVVERDLLLQEKEKLYKEMKDILARQVSIPFAPQDFARHMKVLLLRIHRHRRDIFALIGEATGVFLLCIPPRSKVQTVKKHVSWRDTSSKVSIRPKFTANEAGASNYLSKEWQESGLLPLRLNFTISPREPVPRLISNLGSVTTIIRKLTAWARGCGAAVGVPSKPQGKDEADESDGL